MGNTGVTEHCATRYFQFVAVHRFSNTSLAAVDASPAEPHLQELVFAELRTELVSPLLTLRGTDNLRSQNRFYTYKSFPDTIFIEHLQVEYLNQLFHV